MLETWCEFAGYVCESCSKKILKCSNFPKIRFIRYQMTFQVLCFIINIMQPLCKWSIILSYPVGIRVNELKIPYTVDLHRVYICGVQETAGLNVIFVLKTY